MICTTCKAEGQKSTITSSGGCTTAMYYPPYYDEEASMDGDDVASEMPRVLVA